ncbi:ATP-binding protein [Leifsonia sp. YAF41]|uniref:ATP-binding protein n=1 Tax=Leifsonia sp. YAF41 TaxID=3233086 RepID=UPI003F99DB49
MQSGSDATGSDARLAETTFAAEVLASVATAPPTAVVLIDGPSGAGKSTLADQVLAGWPGERRPTLVRLDDIYPGWGGLDAGIEHLERHVLAPRRAGRPAAWQRFDWTVEAPLEWHTVDPHRPLIVEGCGALARAHTALSDIRVWLDAEDQSRKRRAIARDGERFLAHWDEWQQEWETYYAREDPARQATIRFFAPG